MGEGSGPPPLGAATLIGIGTTSAVCLALPTVLGWLADRWLGTSPLLVLIGLVLGIATCASYTYAQARRFMEP